MSRGRELDTLTQSGGSLPCYTFSLFYLVKAILKQRLFNLFKSLTQFILNFIVNCYFKLSASFGQSFVFPEHCVHLKDTTNAIICKVYFQLKQNRMMAKDRLVIVENDLLLASDQLCLFLMLLDLSAAFDTTDYNSS